MYTTSPLPSIEQTGKLRPQDGSDLLNARTGNKATCLPAAQKRTPSSFSLHRHRLPNAGVLKGKRGCC